MLRSGSVLLFLAFATGYIDTGGSMAVAAIGLHYFISDVNRMHKLSHLRTFRDVLLGLVDHGVTQVAILGDYFPGRILMLAVVAAETSWEIEMADLRRIGAPGSFHQREKISAYIC